MVTKANKLIESKYSRGLIETRIVDACIAKINSLNIDVTPEYIFEIHASELFDAIELKNVDGIYQQMIMAWKNLGEQHLLIPGAIKRINWFGSVEYLKGEGKILLQFSSAIKPYLFAIDGNVTPYTSYMQGMTLKFKGAYSHRIYEFLRQWLRFKNKEFSIEELKDRLELDDQYGRIDNLKNRVIDPAVQEINDYSDLWVKYTQRKAGRRVTHFNFSFDVKDEFNKPKKSPREKIDPKRSDSRARPGESFEDFEKRLGKLK
jgi:plasmid replication initiation protein